MALFEFRVKQIAGSYTGACYTIKKSPALYLARLFLFLETSIFVLDEKGDPLLFNKEHEYENVLNRACRYNAMLDFKGHHALSDEYDRAWERKGLTEEMIRKENLSPYYPVAYHEQFFLEDEFSRRIIVPFWTPMNRNNLKKEG